MSSQSRSPRAHPGSGVRRRPRPSSRGPSHPGVLQGRGGDL